VTYRVGCRGIFSPVTTLGLPTLSLPHARQQVLGSDLNRSESKGGATGPPALPPQNDSVQPMWQETPALREFGLTYVGSGSNSTELAEATRPLMSAMPPPTATKLMRHNQPSLGANSDPTHRSKISHVDSDQSPSQSHVCSIQGPDNPKASR
jgi:hypothetical protein